MVNSLDDCSFYQTIELPSFGLQLGAWDLRDRIDEYLGPIDYHGKRVLEIGTANGFVCYELERRGADVVSFDLEQGLSYDIIPAHSLDIEARIQDHSLGLEKVRNAYWLAHRLFNSQAVVAYGHVNRIPEEIGQFDIAFVGNVLQHLENPFGAIARIAKLAETIVMTETNWVTAADQDDPTMYFLPELRMDKNPWDWCFSWWQVTPGLLRTIFRILGYETLELLHHRQLYLEINEQIPHFTIIGKRLV